MNLSELPKVSANIRPDLAAAILAMPATQFLGLQVMGFEPRGTSRIDLSVREELTFDGHVVQGGLVGVLADYAGVSAAACTLEPGWLAATTGFDIRNVAPAIGERLIAIGYLQYMSRSIGVSRVEVFALNGDQTTLVCVATTTCKAFEMSKSI